MIRFGATTTRTIRWSVAGVTTPLREVEGTIPTSGLPVTGTTAFWMPFDFNPAEIDFVILTFRHKAHTVKNVRNTVNFGTQRVNRAALAGQ